MQNEQKVTRPNQSKPTTEGQKMADKLNKEMVKNLSDPWDPKRHSKPNQK